jgi:DNA-directed RNA polymerase specialized sigma24 family protein
MIKLPSNVIDSMFPAPEHDLDYLLDRRDALAMLLRAIPPRQERAVHLFYFTDLSLEHVAERLGASMVRAQELLADAEAMMQGLARTCFRHLCVNGGAG